MKRTISFSAALVVLAFVMVSCGERTQQVAGDDNAVIENILGRKSVRAYTDQAVEQEKVELLLKAGMAAPSAMDRRPWELVVVTDRQALDIMAESLPYGKMLKGAPLAIVVCGDSEASPLWEHDCSAVAQNILLAAESLGLGAVWTAAYPYQDRIDIVAANTGIPENIKPLCVIPVGYPRGEQTPKDKWNPDKVHYNKW